MSALSVFVLEDRVHLITDGAAYDECGVMHGLIQKVVPLPHLQAVVCARGQIDVARDICFLCSNFLSIAAMQDGLPAVLRSEFPSMLNAAQKGDIGSSIEQQNFDLIVAGVSELTPFALLLTSMEGGSIAPYTFSHVAYAWGSPVPDKLTTDAAAARMRHAPDVAARMILQSQRRAQDPPIVGGYGQLTTVDAAGIHFRQVVDFGDIPGEVMSS